MSNAISRDIRELINGPWVTIRNPRKGSRSEHSLPCCWPAFWETTSLNNSLSLCCSAHRDILIATVGCTCSSETRHRLLPRSIADSENLVHILIYTVHTSDTVLQYILVICIKGAVWLMKQTPKFIERQQTDERRAAMSVLRTTATLSVHNDFRYGGDLYLFITFLFVYLSPS